MNYIQSEAPIFDEADANRSVAKARVPQTLAFQPVGWIASTKATKTSGDFVPVG